MPSEVISDYDINLDIESPEIDMTINLDGEPLFIEWRYQDVTDIVRVNNFIMSYKRGVSTYTITRNADNFISTVTSPTHQWVITRDADNKITSIGVDEL